MIEIRRQADDELCGFVTEHGDGSWRAVSVFGGTLAAGLDRSDAERHVLDEGLASLAELWTLTGEGHEDETVRITQASPSSVTVAIGYYSLPGVPTLSFSRSDLDAGRIVMRLDR